MNGVSVMLDASGTDLRREATSTFARQNVAGCRENRAERAPYGRLFLVNVP